MDMEGVSYIDSIALLLHAGGIRVNGGFAKLVRPVLVCVGMRTGVSEHLGLGRGRQQTGCCEYEDVRSIIASDA